MVQQWADFLDELEAGKMPKLADNVLWLKRAWGKIERGEHTPTLAVIFKIAGAFDCSTAVLMTRTEAQLAEGKVSE